MKNFKAVVRQAYKMMIKATPINSKDEEAYYETLELMEVFLGKPKYKQKLERYDIRFNQEEYIIKVTLDPDGDWVFDPHKFIKTKYEI